MGMKIPIPVLHEIGKLTTIPNEARDPNPKPDTGETLRQGPVLPCGMWRWEKEFAMGAGRSNDDFV